MHPLTGVFTREDMGEDVPEQMLRRIKAYINKFNRRLASLLAKQKVILASVAGMRCGVR